jgi:hypothetical protein
MKMNTATMAWWPGNRYVPQPAIARVVTAVNSQHRVEPRPQAGEG